MRPAILLTTACLLTVIAAEPLFAQQRLFAVMSREIVELDSRHSSLGSVIRRFSLQELGDFPAPFGGGADVVPFGGGQSLAVAGNGGIALFDTMSGAVQRFAFPDFFPVRMIGTDGNARLLVLGTNAVQQRGLALVADARSGSTRFLDLGAWPTVGPFAYAAAADVLFIARPRKINPLFASEFYDIDVIDVRTGALLKTIDISPADAVGLATNAAGTQLFVTRYPAGVLAVDVVSGALSTRNEALPRAYLPLIVDERRNRIVVDLFNEIEAFSMSSLQSIGKVSVPVLPLPTPEPPNSVGLTREFDVSDLSATMFMLQGTAVGFGYYAFTCDTSQLLALDADTGRVRRAVDVSALGADACWADLVRITEPAAPRALTADVAGRQVTFKWQAPFGATKYELEAGSAPGLKNLVTLAVADNSLTIEGVPPGVYHLRVRGINTIGRGEPSQELRLVIP